MGGQCSSFFKKKLDVNGDNKFDWSDVKIIGSNLFGTVKKVALLVQVYLPVLEAAGYKTDKVSEALAGFNQALELTAAIGAQIDALNIPKSLADFNKLGDLNNDGKRDIKDVMIYVSMTQQTLSKALFLAKTPGDQAKINDAITKLHNVNAELINIQNAKNTAELTQIVQDMEADNDEEEDLAGVARNSKV